MSVKTTIKLETMLAESGGSLRYRPDGVWEFESAEGDWLTVSAPSADLEDFLHLVLCVTLNTLLPDPPQAMTVTEVIPA